MIQLADKEVEAILNEEISRCSKIIAENRDTLEKLTDALLEKDTIDIIQIKKILGEKPFPEDEMIKRVIAEVALF